MPTVQIHPEQDGHWNLQEPGAVCQNVSASSTIFYVQDNHGLFPNYRDYAGLTFDTSGVPDKAAVTGAVLTLYASRYDIYGRPGASPWRVRYYHKKAGFASNPFTCADRSNYLTSDSVYLDFNQTTGFKVRSIPNHWINKGGYTSFQLTPGWAHVPQFTAAGVRIWSIESSNPDYWPVLEITYREGPYPFWKFKQS